MSLARSSPSYGTQPYPTALLDIYRSISLPRERRPSVPGLPQDLEGNHASRSPGFNILEDVVTIDTHSGTHIDALGHVWAGDQFYNGFTEDQVFQSGVVIGGIEKVSSMVGRGIMLDVPSYRNVDHMGP